MEEIKDTLDLHGAYPDTALTRLDNFLYQAERNHLQRVKIIHGRGKGKLRKLIHKFLAEHELVKDFFDSDIPSESMAVTFAEIRFVNV